MYVCMYYACMYTNTYKHMYLFELVILPLFCETRSPQNVMYGYSKNKTKMGKITSSRNGYLVLHLI